MTARRRAGACQPSDRWYSVCGGVPVIVRVSPTESQCALMPLNAHCCGDVYALSCRDECVMWPAASSGKCHDPLVDEYSNLLNLATYADDPIVTVYRDDPSDSLDVLSGCSGVWCTWRRVRAAPVANARRFGPGIPEPADSDLPRRIVLHR
jgi:hypothetical protein